MEQAIQREMQIKDWKLAWKFRLIETRNPDWLDIHGTIDVTSTLAEQ